MLVTAMYTVNNVHCTINNVQSKMYIVTYLTIHTQVFIIHDSHTDIAIDCLSIVLGQFIF